MLSLENRSPEEVRHQMKITNTQLYNRIFRVRRMLKQDLEELDCPNES